jgi:hypothetical protein
VRSAGAGRAARSHSKGPSSAKSSVTVASGVIMSPFVIDQAAGMDRSEAAIMVANAMGSPKSDARSRRLAESRMISLALAEESDLAGLRLQRKELEEEEKRLRAMLDVERSKQRRNRALTAAPPEAPLEDALRPTFVDEFSAERGSDMSLASRGAGKAMSDVGGGSSRWWHQQ